jgi:hypothetical protein
MDLGGNVFDMTADFDAATKSVVWFRNGTWEIHRIPYYAQSTAPSARNAFSDYFKYTATGGRCAR